MKKIIALSAAALTAGCMAEPPMEMSAQAQSMLTAELDGRVQAGPPQSCVSYRNLGGNRSVGEGAIIFGDRNNNVVYVNRPQAGCPEIGLGRALKTRTPATQLCAGDIVEVFDPVNGFSHGACGLGEFTPYQRTR
ncbi:MAG TPA: hypothetical protein VK391_02605 [Allosphingosinicella sp.]|nr:hypothetical protein [Allosphingosinicella sp.]